MTKLSIEDLVGDMPEAMIVEALDDDRDGFADDKNPFASIAAEQVERLRALASGTESIDATSDGAVIAKPAKIYNTLGVMS